mmetsp:Transcript_65378/g.105592  ORF Transcript_65378/g.105592 Transcript_65378/m.105592 type:complete len:86 (-) Transcript_65378:869-1126(-)
MDGGIGRRSTAGAAAATDLAKSLIPSDDALQLQLAKAAQRDACHLCLQQGSELSGGAEVAAMAFLAFQTSLRRPESSAGPAAAAR